MDLSQKEWSEQLANDDKAVVLDVRTDEEVADGMIPNATQMDIYNGAQFMEDAKALDSDKHYYVYCRSGGRSAQACAILRSLGVEKTYNLLGGFSEWEGETT
ncbi:MAG: rhodanese-like domain-containing protein [Flavobacteriales bacterium]|jgi:rhodanese-related sulfurtransferase|nr:rhodanese-like domain-containing protein [Flavobacteriales bacterium]